MIYLILFNIYLLYYKKIKTLKAYHIDFFIYLRYFNVY